MRVFYLFVLLILAAPALAQSDPPKHEFRGAWIATVINLDWPTRGASTASQKEDLVFHLDKLQQAGINAALFQVRSEADAMYDSPYEPWSYWLTGEQGTAPDPFYDPLAFAIEEAHKRGMELHAWFNPYRADRDPNDYQPVASHVVNQHPDWILDFGSIKILDPGLPEVRDYVTTVITDVVRRYDIDGVHFDDYFYPYPPNTITNQDDASFGEHGAGFTRDNWRRFNVFRFIRQVRDSIQTTRPEVVFGISPFGIWKSGVPEGIVGLDAYDTLYADAVGWLDNDLIDYVTPQLYWPFGGGQDYGKLAPWWASVRNARHLYPGHGLYRSEPATFSNTLYDASEVPRQVRFNRATEGIQGSVFFRARNLTLFSSKGFADSLKTDLYRYPALPPPMAWKSQDAPGTPTGLTTTAPAGNQTGSVNLTWEAPTSGDTDARFYAVYRVPPSEAGDLAAALTGSRNLAAVTGETAYTDTPPGDGLYTYVVTAVSANSIESAPSNAVSAQGATASEPGTQFASTLEVPRPNPVLTQTEIRFSLRAPASVTVRIVDALGREVARLLDAAPRAADAHAVMWRPEASVGSGTYFVVLDASGERVTRPLVVVR